ncbi:unnamed protein product [Linum trigynum]|uniref:Uncharacterized protein n=1 Tax=Linum trigynum TaxID=586398 RepID=A0AAV2G7A0_9ROSI
MCRALKELARTLRIELHTNSSVAALSYHLRTFCSASLFCSGDRTDPQVTGKCCVAASHMISNQATCCMNPQLIEFFNKRPCYLSKECEAEFMGTEETQSTILLWSTNCLPMHQVNLLHSFRGSPYETLDFAIDRVTHGFWEHSGLHHVGW